MKLGTAVRLMIMGVYLGAPGISGALSTDREQAIEIEADAAELDDQQKKVIYKGNVVATQGSIHLTGDVLTVTYTPERQTKEVFMQGRPARFRQRLNEGEAEGEAVRIEYYAQDSLVHLIENARVTQRGQIYTSHRMVYDINRNVITMKKSTPNEATPSGRPPSAESARVKVIIPPKRNQ